MKEPAPVVSDISIKKNVKTKKITAKESQDSSLNDDDGMPRLIPYW